MSVEEINKNEIGILETENEINFVKKERGHDYFKATLDDTLVKENFIFNQIQGIKF